MAGLRDPGNQHTYRSRHSNSLSLGGVSLPLILSEKDVMVDRRIVWV
jgi:hypothetical protein